MDKNKRTIRVLVFVIIILLLFILYVFIVRPAITGYVVDRQNEGAQFAILSIMQQAASCQTVPLTFENQTINLVAVECLQAPPQ